MEDNCITIDENWSEKSMEEFKDLSKEWDDLMLSSKESLKVFDKEGKVSGIVSSLRSLIDYNTRARIFEDKVNEMNDTINQIKHGDITWQ